MSLNLRAIDLNLLTVFDAIMEAGQLSKAGKRLGMSQPAVSAALQRLRETANDPLFVRTHQGMRPTPRAKQLHESVKEALVLIRDELQRGHEFDAIACNRVFKALGGDYFEVVLMGALLRKVRRSAPDACVQVSPLVPSGFAEDLKRGELDIAIHYRVPDDTELRHEHLFDDRLVVMVGPDHPRIRGELSVDTYFREAHVTLPRSLENRSHLDHFLESYHDKRSVSAHVTHFSSMIPLVLQTDLAATVPERLARRFQAIAPLQLLPYPEPIPDLSIQAIWASLYDQDPAHEWFRRLLFETAACA